MEILESLLAFLFEMADANDPLRYAHRLANSGNPIVGAVLVGIPVIGLLLAPVGYWLYWEAARDKKRRRREKARMAKYETRARESRRAS